MGGLITNACCCLFPVLAVDHSLFKVCTSFPAELDTSIYPHNLGSTKESFLGSSGILRLPLYQVCFIYLFSFPLLYPLLSVRQTQCISYARPVFSPFLLGVVCPTWNTRHMWIQTIGGKKKRQFLYNDILQEKKTTWTQPQAENPQTCYMWYFSGATGLGLLCSAQ